MADLYVACYGTILLRLNDNLFYELEKLWNEGLEEKDYYKPYYEKVFSLQNQFLNNLKNNKYITNVDIFGDFREEHNEPFKDYLNPKNDYLMQFSAPIRFNVKLPLEKRTYPSRVQYTEKVITTFSVIYDGKIFLAYAPIEDDISESYFICPEIREYLLKLFACDYWLPMIIAPCPLRFNFYIASEKKYPSIKLDLDLDTKIIHPYMYKNKIDLQTLTICIYIQNNFAIECFYSIMTIEQKIKNIIFNLESLYSEIKDNFYSYKKNIFIFKFLFKYKTLNSRILELHDLMYDYDKYLFKYKKEVDSFFQLFKTEEIIDYLNNYFLEEFKIAEYPQDNILKTIEYIQNKTNLNSTNFYVIISVLLGTVLGFLLNIIF